MVLAAIVLQTVIGRPQGPGMFGSATRQVPTHKLLSAAVVRLLERAPRRVTERPAMALASWVTPGRDQGPRERVGVGARPFAVVPIVQWLDLPPPTRA